MQSDIKSVLVDFQADVAAMELNFSRLQSQFEEMDTAVKEADDNLCAARRNLATAKAFAKLMGWKHEC